MHRPMPTATSEWMRRLRSSTRWSKNDIFPVGSSCSSGGSVWLGVTISRFLSRRRLLRAERIRGGLRRDMLVGVNSPSVDRASGQHSGRRGWFNRVLLFRAERSRGGPVRYTLVGVDSRGADWALGRHSGRRRLKRLAGFGLEFLRVPLEVAHLLIDGHAQFRRVLPELGQGLADGAAKLGQLSRPKDNEGDDKDDDQFGDANASHRAGCLLRIIEDGSNSVKQDLDICYTAFWLQKARRKCGRRNAARCWSLVFCSFPQCWAGSMGLRSKPQPRAPAIFRKLSRTSRECWPSSSRIMPCRLTPTTPSTKAPSPGCCGSWIPTPTFSIRANFRFCAKSSAANITAWA